MNDFGEMTPYERAKMNIERLHDLRANLECGRHRDALRLARDVEESARRIASDLKAKRAVVK